MNFLRPLALLPILPAALVGGCAVNEASYPSLAVRPIERVEITAAPVAPASQPTAPAAASDTVAAAVSAAHQADSAFQVKLAASRAAIEAGRSAGRGSETWIVAQQAYSDVESAKAGIGSALADLDQMHQQAIAAGDAARLSEVETAIVDIQGLDQAAQTVLESLRPSET